MRFLLVLLSFLTVAMSTPSSYQTTQKDFFDAGYLKIEESKYLGKEIEDINLILPEGKKKLSDFVGNSPLILIPAYYTCGGSCPVLIGRLVNKLSGIQEDYRVLVVSFDKRDTLETLKVFVDRLPGEKLSKWKFALIEAADINKFKESTGFNFFYSERDKSFVHPTVSIFLSPDGIITRYLYGVNPSETDLRLSILDAKREFIKPNEVVKLALLACYTYDPNRSKYVINPLLIFGGLGFALVGTVGFIVFSYGRTSRGGV